jgi:transposase
VDSEEREQLRAQLLKQAKADPESVVDLVLDLMDTLAQLTVRTQQLAARVEQLEDQLKKNSGNSSKPPSTDKGSSSRPKQRSLRGKSGKKPGGQKGHRGTTLQRVDDPDETIVHSLEFCPITGRKLSEADVVDEIRCQVFDIPEPKMSVTEHVYPVYRVPGSSQTVHSPFICGASAPVQYGSRFSSLIVYLSDYQLIPLSRVCQLCGDLFGQKISEDTVVKFRKGCYEHLERFEEHLKKQLSQSPVLHADETGIKVGKKTEWLHVLSSAELTYLWPSDHRGSQAIDEMGILREYEGTLVHDCFGSYFTLDCSHALCNAHLLRELNFFIDIKEHKWAGRMKELLCQALEEPESTTSRGWNQRYANILSAANAEHPYQPPVRRKNKRGRTAKPPVNNLIERFEKHRDDILRFISDQGVPFTNNQGERDLRMAKVQQKISGTFRTWAGARRFARIRSYVSTAQKQGVSVYQALRQAILGQPMFAS